MRTTLTIDDDMLERAKEFSGISDNRKLVDRAMEYIIVHEKAMARVEETGDTYDFKKVLRKFFEKVEDD